MTNAWRPIRARPRDLAIALAMIAILAGVEAPLAASANEDPGPMARVRGAVSEVVSILQEENSTREDRWRRIASVIEANFDFRSMSQSILSTNWKRATPEERRQFTEYFSQYIESTFRDQIEAYSDQRIDFLGQQVRGDRAIVNTEVVSGRVRTPVTYKLRKDPSSTEWLAYDVVIEGVSLVANYRDTFAAIVKTEGMNGLILDVQQRIDRYRSSRGQ